MHIFIYFINILASSEESCCKKRKMQNSPDVFASNPLLNTQDGELKVCPGSCTEPKETKTLKRFRSLDSNNDQIQTNKQVKSDSKPLTLKDSSNLILKDQAEIQNFLDNELIDYFDNLNNFLVENADYLKDNQTLRTPEPNLESVDDTQLSETNSEQDINPQTLSRSPCSFNN